MVRYRFAFSRNGIQTNESRSVGSTYRECFLLLYFICLLFLVYLDLTKDLFDKQLTGHRYTGFS
jgi:hypothetical protein